MVWVFRLILIIVFLGLSDLDVRQTVIDVRVVPFFHSMLIDSKASTYSSKLRVSIHISSLIFVVRLREIISRVLVIVSLTNRRRWLVVNLRKTTHVWPFISLVRSRILSLWVWTFNNELFSYTFEHASSLLSFFPHFLCILYLFSSLFGIIICVLTSSCWNITHFIILPNYI